MYLIAPDEVRLEIIEDTSIPTPVAMHHIHLWVTDPLAAQAWYVKHFGAVAGKRGMFDTATVPGAEITFAKQDAAQAHTKGRSIDHIGFEVKNIEQFLKKLEAEGIPPETTLRNSANAPKLKIAYIVDPWGTYIEITEGLAPSASASN